MKNGWLWLLLFTSLATFADTLPTQMINHIAQQFIEDNQIPGVAIDLVYQGKPYYLNYGVANSITNTPISNDTIFEIGSATKVFTATLLAMEVNAKRIKLDDPIGPYLPEPLHGDKFAVDKLTFLQLATHTSSLPNNPPNFLPPTPSDLPQLSQFLSQWQPDSPVGTRYQYSNIGFGIIGYALAGLNNQPFLALLQSELLQPLAMDDTDAIVPMLKQNRYAIGYQSDNTPAPRWQTMGWRVSASILRSTPQDMMTFLQANLGNNSVSDNIKQAMQLTHTPFYKVNDNMSQGLGWAIVPLANSLTMIIKNGTTSGFTTVIAFIPEKNSGVVILANKKGVDINQCARDLLMALNGS